MAQRSIGSALMIGACVCVGILCFGAFATKGLDREGPDTEPTEVVDFMPDRPDCDKDDRSPHWEVADCGPSPTPRPVKTAFQPKPTKKPTPKVTRR
jgi:hypothetical protein